MIVFLSSKNYDYILELIHDIIFQVLELMREVREEVEDEGQHSDLSPYHSDSDSAVMMSGNSPFISKVGHHVVFLEVKLRDNLLLSRYFGCL